MPDLHSAEEAHGELGGLLQGGQAPILSTGRTTQQASDLLPPPLGGKGVPLHRATPLGTRMGHPEQCWETVVSRQEPEQGMWRGPRTALDGHTGRVQWAVVSRSFN